MHEVIIEGPNKNALGSALMGSLLRQIEAGRGEPLLLRGAGGVFSAGLDLKELAELDVAGMDRFLTLLGELSAALFDYPGPTVALVEGHAIAGGCVLALCCDWRVGASGPRARIGLNEVALGLRFPQRLLRMLAHQVPTLERAVLQAGLHDPAGALRLALLDEVVDDAPAVARARLEERAAHPRPAYAAAKAAFRGGLSVMRPEEERAFREEVLPAWTSPELKARIRAVLKR
jgi:enoyl-CoA hydratase